MSYSKSNKIKARNITSSGSVSGENLNVSRLNFNKAFCNSKNRTCKLTDILITVRNVPVGQWCAQMLGNKVYLLYNCKDS